MVMDTGLADRIRAKDVRVIEVAGWTTRSAGTYDPEGTVNHHTAGSVRGATPSLATVIYGRPDVPGPLAQVLQSREPDPADDIAYVIAAGRSNNAGSGSWRGISGNRRVGGLEVEHTGLGRVDVARLEIAARINAALAEAPGSPRDAGNTCQHFEWTSRKIDFHDLYPWTPAGFRARVHHWIGRTAGTPAPPVPELEGDDPMLIRYPGGVVLLAAGKLVRVTGEQNVQNARAGGVPVWSVEADDYKRIEKAYGPVVEG